QLARRQHREGQAECAHAVGRGRGRCRVRHAGCWRCCWQWRPDDGPCWCWWIRRIGCRSVCLGRAVADAVIARIRVRRRALDAQRCCGCVACAVRGVGRGARRGGGCWCRLPRRLGRRFRRRWWWLGRRFCSAQRRRRRVGSSCRCRCVRREYRQLGRHARPRHARRPAADARRALAAADAWRVGGARLIVIIIDCDSGSGRQQSFYRRRVLCVGGAARHGCPGVGPARHDPRGCARAAAGHRAARGECRHAGDRPRLRRAARPAARARREARPRHRHPRRAQGRAGHH
ncbi:hypothetical protein EV177_009773, partial [Coemansia sp. RSA 1804]